MKPTVYSLQPAARFRPQSIAYSLRSASAFTLVELMVVVAVISLLLMLLIPNIRTMREKALSANCQNNLRQYGIAMNQYMADKGGYFIYPGAGVGDATYKGGGDAILSDYQSRKVTGATVGGASADYWGNFISHYLGANVTLASLSAGEPSVRVCPVILRDLHNVNYFDPILEGKGFKGYGEYKDYYTEKLEKFSDFESSSGYDDADNLILDAAFTTYAINRRQLYANKKDIPANVIAFIDWNARDGWWATLSYTNWMFTGTNAAGVAVTQGSPKWTNAWWLTEVGFHHLHGNEYGANYVAMDGHVGWISSNAISETNFTTGL